MSIYNIDREMEEGLKRSEELLKRQRIIRLITTMIVIVLAFMGFAAIGGGAYFLGSRSSTVPTPEKQIVVVTATPVLSLTASPVPTKTKTPQPTETKITVKTVTRTPTLKGPIKISDNFESNLTNWKNCDQCQIRDGTNDREARKVYIPVGEGHVGLIVGLHSLAVAFDNFIFEELVP